MDALPGRHNKAMHADAGLVRSGFRFANLINALLRRTVGVPCAGDGRVGR